ncbi:MAG: hypothetical protein ACREXP_15520, partial [Steroidobacteraceae bacterium]
MSSDQQLTSSELSVLSERAIIRALGFEANTPYADIAYRKSAFISLLILGRMLLRAAQSALSAPPPALPCGAHLAFSMFKNEKSAIEEHIGATGDDWCHISLDLKRLTGLSFLRILAAIPLHGPRFFYHLVGAYGLRSLKTFPYPLLGYLIYKHLQRSLGSLRPGRIVTANISHPVSLGIHYAAMSAGLATAYLEHAATPRLIAHDHGYDEILVRSPH